MANAKTQIEVTVLDKASRALDKIKGKFAGLNKGKVGEAMAHITRATSQSVRCWARMRPPAVWLPLVRVCLPRV